MRELPAQDVSQVDEIVSTQIATNNEGSEPARAQRQMIRISALLVAAKFSTRPLHDSMLRFYQEQTWSCAPEHWFIAYFARVDAEEGARIFARAMAEREKTACFQSLIGGVSAIVWNPVVEAQAISALRDTDNEAAADAALALAAHGGKQAEAALWGRLEQLSQRPQAPSEHSAVVPVLIRELANARSWILDEPRARRLNGFCTDQACHEQYANYKLGAVKIWLWHGLYGNEDMFQMGGLYPARNLDDVKARIQQYPDATVFELCLQSREDAAQEIEAFAASHHRPSEACRNAP